jgi:hypothetical protein
MGAMTPPSRKSCYNFRVISIDRVLDGDTIDVTIDLGFDLYKKERVRVAGVDTPSLFALSLLVGSVSTVAFLAGFMSGTASCPLTNK